MEIKMDSIEIYPRIVVYKNMFSNIQNHIQTLKDSHRNDTDFWKWTKWGTWGYYVTPENYKIKVDIDSSGLNFIKDYNPINELEQRQYDLTKETMKNLVAVNNDYIKRHNLDIDTSEVVDKTNKRWFWHRPNFCATAQAIDPGGSFGSAGPEARKAGLALTYHSDFIREAMQSPGYKFVFTSNVYFNDDYEGGEIDFCIGNKLIQYKPEAGDIVVFPAGHPEYLTENGIVYIHGVKTVMGNEKYFCRSYWSKYQEASPEWIENENRFGKDEWEKIYSEEIMPKFRENNPNRVVINGGVRLK